MLQAINGLLAQDTTCVAYAYLSAKVSFNYITLCKNAGSKHHVRKSQQTCGAPEQIQNCNHSTESCFGALRKRQLLQL